MSNVSSCVTFFLNWDTCVAMVITVLTKEEIRVRYILQLNAHVVFENC